MIIRILGEGQYELPEDVLPMLDELDDELNSTIEADDEAAFEKALGRLLAKVKEAGKPVAIDTLVPSDLTVPPEGSTLDDVRQLLTSEPDDTSVSEGA